MQLIRENLLETIRDEILHSTTNYHAWSALSGRNIRSMNRRSQLGSLWIMLSAMIFVGVLSLVYAAVFRIPVSGLMPYITVGYILWQYIGGLLGSSPMVFASYGEYIKSASHPITTYVFALAYRSLNVLIRQSAVIVLVCLIFRVGLHPSVMFAIPALFILFMTSIPTITILGILGIRFRDLAEIVNSSLMAIFLVTPILWRPDFLEDRAFFIDLNPLYHFIHIFRAPLLDGYVPWASVVISIVICLLLWFFSIFLLAKYRHRVVFWL